MISRRDYCEKFLYILLSSALLFAQEKKKDTFLFEFEQDSLEIQCWRREADYYQTSQ